MKRFVSLFFLTFLSANNIEVVPFDWGGQFGYLNQGGAIFWNSDWRSNNLLFDGTWTVYPRMFGPEIKNGFKPNNQSMIVGRDSVGIISSFQYDQGDYLLDRFGFTMDYNMNKRNAKLHGFKRTYAGGINQYSNGSLQPQQQSYIFSYQSKEGKDGGGISLGHFNTNSGFPDSSDGSLIDNRITTSNLFWNKDSEKLDIRLSIDYFLQRYKTRHSLALTEKSRYLTREQYQLELAYPLFNFHTILSFGKNIRGIKTGNLKSTEWDDVVLRVNTKQINFSAGLFYFNKISYFKRAVNIDKIFGLAQINFHYNYNYKPIHPYFKISQPGTVQNLIPIESISGSFILNLKKNIFTTVISRIEDKSKMNYEIDKGSQNFESSYERINFIYKTNMIPFFDTEINYVIQGQEGFYSAAVGEWFGLKLYSSFELFDKYMLIDINSELKHYKNRRTKSYFNFIEMVPVLSPEIKSYEPINIFSASITAKVSKFIIAYEWYNISQLIFRAINSYQNNYFELQPDMPALGRQVNLTISWMFQD